MDELSHFKLNAFEKILAVYPQCVIDEIKSDKNIIIFRLPMENAAHAEEFKLLLSKVTDSAWIVYSGRQQFERVIFSKTWVCQHNQKNKGRKSARNADCSAKLKICIKKVTKDTYRKDKFLKYDPPLTGEVKLSLQHTHNTTAAATLKMLRVDERVKQAYHEYFSNGLGPAEALRYHENTILSEENYDDLAKASVNPTRRQVHYLHNVWREHNFGSFINPLEMLKEKLELYKSKGAIVKINDKEPWSVVVVTEVMQRLHPLETSKEIIFVDSTCSCEAALTSVTVLLTTTKIGALPLAVLIHPAQTTESYFNSFQLLKQNFPFCFGGKPYPEIFMTDDSAAEKQALKSIWPGSVQLLCHFHVAQAEWRWLFSHSEEVEKSERPRLMKLFQAVMYAKTEDELNLASANIMKEKGKHPKFVNRFLKFLERKEEWILLYRMQLLTRQNNTNNYAEATIRILKDIVLCRTKAFNVVALVDFCVSMWEPYLKRKLLEYAHSRKGVVNVLYQQFLKKTVNYAPEDIQLVAPNLFSIKNDSGDTYFVNSEICLCSCPSGMSGGFCKHQFFLMKEKKLSFINAPPLSPSERYNLSVLALGDNCAKPSFYNNFNEDDDLNNACTATVITDVTNQLTTHSDLNTNSLGVEMASNEQKEVIKKEINKISSLIDQNIGRNTADKLLRVFKQINNVDDLNKLYFIKSKIVKKITVQPTSLARRRPGLTRSATRIPSGRPPSKLQHKTNKRKRNLSKNIDENKPNAKSHGLNH